MPNDFRVSIMIVDDLPDKLMALEVAVEGLDAHVVTARSGQEALRRITEYDFAVILMDVNMPDMDGFETAELIRQRKKYNHIPIIFITAYADEIYTARGYSLGAVDYILSPVVPEILRTKVGVFIELYKKTQEARHHAEERIALEREKLARASAEEATRRSTLLADAGSILASSLEMETLLPGFLGSLIPRLGDLGAIALVDDNGKNWKTLLAWVDPDSNDDVHVRSDLQSLQALPLADALQRALTSGQPELLTSLSESAKSVETHAVQGRPGFKLQFAMIAPLLSRRRTVGVLLLASGTSGRHFQFADLALAEDLADRAAMAIDNAVLYRSIQERDQRKNEFLSMLAHELRNPLAPIRNAVHIMKSQGPQNPQLEWAGDMIDRQVQHLARMVDDLLDVARITSGKINLQLKEVDVHEMIVNAVETSRPLVDTRKHELKITMSPKPIRVLGDPVRLAQILTNLLNNAAKFTEEGGRIELSVVPEESEAVIRVRDNGIGIPAPILSSIFDLFSQADRSLDRSQGGLGIGLTLVRRLVEMHGGTVTAHSQGTNQGSEFIVRLPILMKSSAPSPIVNGVPQASSRMEHRRILIVDDNTDSASSLAVLLRLEQHEVQTAPDGRKALEVADAFRPDVILLDIGLPEMDGYEVARRIRAMPELNGVTLIALTGYGQDEDRRRALDAGFDHHLVKPVDIPVLYELIHSKSM